MWLIGNCSFYFLGVLNFAHVGEYCIARFDFVIRGKLFLAQLHIAMEDP